MNATCPVGAWWIRSMRSASVGAQAVAGLGGELCQTLLDLRQRDLPVDARFTQAEQVQVRAIEQQDM
jgi:hypothetical protein